MLKTSPVIDARDESIQRAEVLLKKLIEVSEQLKIPEPVREQIQQKIQEPAMQPRTPSDSLLDVISYVIQAENAGTISETRQKTQAIKDRALNIKEKAAQLRAKIDALNGCTQEMLLVSQEQCATEEQIRHSSEKLRQADKN